MLYLFDFLAMLLAAGSTVYLCIVAPNRFAALIQKWQGRKRGGGNSGRFRALYPAKRYKSDYDGDAAIVADALWTDSGRPRAYDLDIVALMLKEKWEKAAPASTPASVRNAERAKLATEIRQAITARIRQSKDMADTAIYVEVSEIIEQMVPEA